MRRHHFLLVAYLVVVASMLASTGEPADNAAAPRQDAQAPTYMNAEVIGVDTTASTITLKSESGQTILQVEDQVRAGLSELRQKDKVIVTYRVVDDGAGGTRHVVTQVRPASPGSGEPGPAAKAAAPPPAPARTVTTGVVVAPPAAGAVAVTPAELEAIRASAAQDFEVATAQLAVQANAIDGLWLGFQQACLAEPPPTNRSRGWFQLLDGTLPEPDQDGCRQQYHEIIRRGERLKESIKLAEDTARKAEVLSGVLRETLERHRLDL